jgi:hypothetical protein
MNLCMKGLPVFRISKIGHCLKRYAQEGQKVLILEIEADIYCLESNLWDPNEKMLTFGNMLLL